MGGAADGAAVAAVQQHRAVVAHAQSQQQGQQLGVGQLVPERAMLQPFGVEIGGAGDMGLQKRLLWRTAADLEQAATLLAWVAEQGRQPGRGQQLAPARQVRAGQQGGGQFGGKAGAGGRILGSPGSSRLSQAPVTVSHSIYLRGWSSPNCCGAFRMQ